MDGQVTFTVDQRLVNALLLHSGFITNTGLLHGKTGIAIFFYHLARQTGNPLYEGYAGELLDEVYEEVSLQTPFDFADGLAGIGWGIEHLVQNGFVEADTDKVLAEFDRRLTLCFSCLPKSIGLSDGLAGFAAYLLKRIGSIHAGNKNLQTTATRVEERVCCAFGLTLETEPSFEPGLSIFMGGVLVTRNPAFVSGLSQNKHYHHQLYASPLLACRIYVRQVDTGELLLIHETRICT